MVLVAWGLVACDQSQTKRDLDSIIEAGAPASTPSTSAAAAPRGPQLPKIRLDATTVTVDGEPTEARGPDFPARFFMLVSGNPLVAGGTVDVDVDRMTRPSQANVILAALKNAHAKGVNVHTGTRDKAIGVLSLVFPKPPVSDCSVVGFIGKDASISVWSIGGGTARRFTKGFAGPDMTLGTDAVRKAASACDSPVWFVAADDAMTWGLVFDLATMARAGDEGGAPLKPTNVGVLTDAPVPGRKVTIS